MHRASAQVTVSPQQNLLPGLPLILPAQSAGQVIQFSPLLGWQIPSPLQVETFASVVVTTSNPTVALVVVTKSGPTIASGCSPMRDAEYVEELQLYSRSKLQPDSSQVKFKA